MGAVIITVILLGSFLFVMMAGAARSKDREKEDKEQIEYLTRLVETGSN